MESHAGRPAARALLFCQTKPCGACCSGWPLHSNSTNLYLFGLAADSISACIVSTRTKFIFSMPCLTKGVLSHAEVKGLATVSFLREAEVKNVELLFLFLREAALHEVSANPPHPHATSREIPTLGSWARTQTRDASG